MLFQALLSSGVTSVYYSLAVPQLAPSRSISSSSLLRTTSADLRWFCKGARNSPNCNHNQQPLVPTFGDYSMPDYRLHPQASASVLVLKMPALSLTPLLPPATVRPPCLGEILPLTTHVEGETHRVDVTYDSWPSSKYEQPFVFLKIKLLYCWFISNISQSSGQKYCCLKGSSPGKEVFRGRMKDRLGGLAAVCSKLDFSIIRIYYLVSIDNVVS